MDIVYPFKVVSWDVKKGQQNTNHRVKNKICSEPRSLCIVSSLSKKSNKSESSISCRPGDGGGSMFYLPRFPTHWHRNCRVPLSNEPHFFSCCAQYASSIFSSYWPNARKLAIPSWMVELVCVYCCTTSSFDSRVMPMRLSVLVEMVSMANEWTSLNSSNFKTTVTLCFCCKCTRLRRWFESNVT